MKERGREGERGEGGGAETETDDGIIILMLACMSCHDCNLFKLMVIEGWQ